MKINRRVIFISLAFAALFYIGMTIWSNVSTLQETLSHFKWQYLPIIFLLTLANYSIRFLNWQYYLNTLGLRKVPRLNSFLIFISGFSMAITPGKVGELIRSVLLKDIYSIPFSKTGSIVLVDRLTDITALMILAGIGALQFQYGGLIFLVLGIIIDIIFITISWRKLAEAILIQLGKIGFIKPKIDKLYELYESSYILLRPRALFTILFISMLAWSCEALGFYLTFKALDLSVALPIAFFIYSFSTIVGAISLLPGGLGFTEGSMTGLLILVNIGKAPAAAATLVIRAATLWFGVIIGSLALVFIQKRTHTHIPVSNE